MVLSEHRTHRGFAFVEAHDSYGKQFSIQKSSLATDDAIWFGIDDPEPRVLKPGQGWVPLELPADVNINTRMHLTREQVAQLLPVLQHFVDTGEVRLSAEPQGVLA